MFLKDANNFTVNKASTLTTARTINGTSFSGSANITTANWGTARTLTIGSASKSVNGSANISWTLSEIGAAAASHTHNSITNQDTRNVNTTPTQMPLGLSVHLKSNGTDGLSDGGSYHSTLMIKGWNDVSGGPWAQMTVTANNNLYFRSSNNDTWNAWKKVSLDGHTHNYAGSSSAGGAANSAVKATQDSAGQQINTTYIKGLSVSGKTITYTKGDGTTGTITTQDTNTTYSTGTASTSGLTKLYTGTGTATDGTMTQAAINTALSGKANSSHGTHVPSTCNTITDWNSATTTGWYMASGATNAPTANAWYFGEVIAHNTNYVIQTVYQFTASTDAKAIPKYIRAKMNGTWGSWTNVTVAKAVPSNAVFTDTNTWRGVQDNLTSTATDQSLSANQGKVLKGLIDGKAASSHTHSYLPLAGGTLTGKIDVPGESKFCQGTYVDPWEGTICAIKASGNVGIGGSLKVNESIAVGQKVGASILEANTDLILNRYGFSSFYTNNAAGSYIYCGKNDSCINLTDNNMVYRNPNGSLEIGPQNAVHCHIYTDRPTFYFNRDLIVNGNRVYHAGNKPTPSEIGAAPALAFANSYYGMVTNDGNSSNWIRTTQNGIIPYQSNSSGSSSLGTSGWPFSTVYATNFYGTLNGNATHWGGRQVWWGAAGSRPGNGYIQFVW